MSERKEAWMRIVVAIISGIIISLWKTLVAALTLFHWFYVVFSGRRSKGIAEFCNLWLAQYYAFARYMTFATNSRPFPFSELAQAIKPVDKKEKK